MKRFLCLCLLLFLLFGCAKEEKSLDFETAASRILEASENGAFVRADEDFVKTNFGAPDYLTEAVVYYAERDDGTEFGFFRVSDAMHVSDMEQTVSEYLATEREAVESLAALYPAEELNARLARFQHAKTGARDTVVYYCLGDDALCKAFERAIR